MAQEFSRIQRIADQIQKELALLIQREVKDPRVGMVTITAVRVSRELDHAVVYFTALGLNASEQRIEESTQGLNKAAGFLRSELSKRLKIRTTPKLKFVYDSSIEDGNRLSALIDSALAETDSDIGSQNSAS